MANPLPSLLASGFAPSGPLPSRILGRLDELARAATARGATPPRWALLLELDDPALVEDLLARGLRVMLVLPQAWRVARLAEAVEDLNQPGLRLCGELLAAQPGEVCWYRYNDPRCDGLLSPQELAASRPNLRLDALEMRPLHTLDSLRHAWIESDGPLEGEGLLLLRDAGQLELLAGADLLLNDLAALAWFAPSAGGAEPGDPLRASLAARFLVPWPEADPGHWWRRDAALELNAERRSLQQLLARSTGQLEQLRGEREALALRQAELQAERDGLLQTQAEQAAQLALRDSQAAQRQQQFEVLQQECLALQAARDQALAERDQAQQQCEELQAGNVRLQAEAERLREDLHEALRARQRQQDQLAALTDRAEQSSCELDELRLRLALLIEAAVPNDPT